MKTLVNDPFKDDAAEFLDWAYGKLAGFEMRDRMFAYDERPGQAFMNVLRKYDPAEYTRLTGTNVDPFYVDSKIFAALDKLTSK